jgi:hypothetical protein
MIPDSVMNEKETFLYIKDVVRMNYEVFRVKYSFFAMSPYTN